MRRSWFLFALMFLVAACNGEADPDEHADEPANESAGESHEGHGPKHGGEVLVLGNEAAHAEVKCERDHGEFMLWTYGADMKDVTPDAPPVLNMVLPTGPKQLTATGEGSVWTFEDEALKTETEVWSLRIVIGGATYSPKLPHLDCQHEEGDEHDDE